MYKRSIVFSATVPIEERGPDKQGPVKGDWKHYIQYLQAGKRQEYEHTFTGNDGSGGNQSARLSGGKQANTGDCVGFANGNRRPRLRRCWFGRFRLWIEKQTEWDDRTAAALAALTGCNVGGHEPATHAKHRAMQRNTLGTDGNPCGKWNYGHNVLHK